MPTRKQRKRRAKDVPPRHAGVRGGLRGQRGSPLAELRTPEERKPKVKQQQAKSKSARPIKVPPLPSWNRAIKRGGTMGGLMLVAFLFVLKSGPLPQRIGIGVFYGLAFIPLTTGSTAPRTAPISAGSRSKREVLNSTRSAYGGGPVSAKSQVVRKQAGPQAEAQCGRKGDGAGSHGAVPTFANTRRTPPRAYPSGTATCRIRA